MTKAEKAKGNALPLVLPTTHDLLAARFQGTGLMLQLSALESFNTRGFHSTTTRQISDSAGVSPGTIYVHFQNKHDMLFHLCEIAHRSALRTVQECIRETSRDADPSRELLDVVRVFTSWHGINPTLARVAQYEFQHLSGAQLATIVTLRRETEAAIRDCVNRTLARLGISEDRAYGIGTVVISLGVDLSRWFRPGGRMSAMDVGELYADCVARMLVQP